MAKAYKQAEHTVLAYDNNEATLGYAKIAGIADGVLDDDTLCSCDLLFIALYPQGAVEYLTKIAPKIDSHTVVMDLCGTKKEICACGFALAKQYGFTFVGGHPMAGTHFSGYKYSKATLFSGASFIMVPPVHDDIALLDRVKQAIEPLGFKKFVVTTADFHDRMIAYTSQMCHVVSNAFIKSPAAKFHRGYSAGSFRDFTRVSRLNENMWTELFLENKEHLLGELDLLITSLHQYRDAIAADDADTLRGLLRDGRIAKEEAEK